MTKIKLVTNNQCCCLENPRDGRAWWAAVSWVTQSWTRLMRLSSSSSNSYLKTPQILGNCYITHGLQTEQRGV